MNSPSGPVLALDTSTQFGSVALGSGGSLVAETLLGVAAGHSGALLPAVDAALRSAGLVPGELAAVVVAGGPGSFTGLRVAAATAKGIVHALGIPLFAYGSLLAAAAGAMSFGRPVCALFDARRRDVFAACYRFGASWETVLEPSALSVDALLERFQGGDAPVFTGHGAELHRAELEQLPGATVAPALLVVPRASALLWLLQTAPELGAVPDAATWEPDYLRPSGAERIAAGARS